MPEDESIIFLLQRLVLRVHHLLNDDGRRDRWTNLPEKSWPFLDNGSTGRPLLLLLFTSLWTWRDKSIKREVNRQALQCQVFRTWLTVNIGRLIGLNVRFILASSSRERTRGPINRTQWNTGPQAVLCERLMFVHDMFSLLRWWKASMPVTQLLKEKMGELACRPIIVVRPLNFSFICVIRLPLGGLIKKMKGNQWWGALN